MARPRAGGKEHETKSMKRGLIGLLGVALFIAGGVLFVMVSQTASHACVFVRLLPGGGWECHTATPEYPTYPLAQQMGQLWSPEALVYANLYLSVLAVSVGVTLMLVCVSGLATRDDTKPSVLVRAGWVAFGTSLVVGVALANVAGQPILSVGPPWWNSEVLITSLLFTAPWTARDLLIMSVLLIPVGFALKSGSGRAGWVALLMALLFGVALANVAGQTFPPLSPCWGVLGCPPWNPGPFGPPIGTLLHTAPLAALAILGMSVLLSLVGFALTRRTRGTLTPIVVRGLQLAPLLAVTIIGLAALFLFPLPYAL
jgi:hypothetical protein